MHLCVCVGGGNAAPRGNSIGDALRLPLRHSDKHTRALAAVKKTFRRLGSRRFGHMVAAADGREGSTDGGREGQSLSGQMTGLGSGSNWDARDGRRVTQFRACDGARLNINPYM